ncbi:MAG: FAD-dependent oxidoreductase [Candidatus Thermoplasmatota archaeon]|nr:FAD-dependent oxidoreductase [Candidatus Thermoplasmatota archaeon]
MTVEISINNRKYRVPRDITVLEACHKAGFEIPTLCRDKHRERPFTSCFICLVEIQGAPRFAPACGTKVREGLIIKVENEKIFNARKTGLELLLSDHNADCKPPCHWKCPAHADVQGYVNAIANSDFRTSIEILRKRIPLPATLGRVCPHPCEADCRRNYVDRPVSIRNLKRFVADWDLEYGPFLPEVKNETGNKIAIVGGGPAGLSCAYYLRQEGHAITIFEQMPSLGGMLRYGIPEYRLPKAVLQKEIDAIISMGINVKTNHRLGRDFSLDELEKEYDAVFLSIGAWKSKGLQLEGEDHPSIIGGIDLLREVALGKPSRLGERVVVVGGGNTAIDAARTALRMGSKTTILYRRTKAEMPAEAYEIEEAAEEGVEFIFLTAPVGIALEGSELKGIRCIKMELGEPDESGRRRPKPIEGSEFLLEADAVIKAIGQDIEKGIISEEKVDQTKWGTVKIQMPIYKTNRSKVFAGGDLVKGPSLVVDAVYMGRKASEAIICMLNDEAFPNIMDIVSTRRNVDESLFVDVERVERIEPKYLPPKVRRTNFREVDLGFTTKEAVSEASRCMSCGCQDVYECKLKLYMNDHQADPRRFQGATHDHKVDDSHPYILREPNKCVKCGKCVEICDRYRGISVYGFAARGFDTMVAPTLNRPLVETDCISCGDCVSVCPVGALTEKIPLVKPGPFPARTTPSVCTRCSVGCMIDIETVNDRFYRVTPRSNLWNDVHMCETGRFDFTWMNDPGRFHLPLIKAEEGFKETSWEEAITLMAVKVKETPTIILRPTCTNEEAYIAREIVRRLGGEIYLIVDDHETCDGLYPVLGNSGSTITFDEIEKQDQIMIYNTDLVNRFSVVGVKVRDAALKGKSVMVVGGKPHRIKGAKVFKNTGPGFLEGLIATAAREQLISGHAYDLVSYSEQEILKKLSMLSQEDIEDLSGSSYDELSRMARTLSTENGVIIFGMSTKEEARRIALFKQITDVQLIVLKRGSNSQGISDLEIPRITIKELEELGRKSIFMVGYPPEDFKRPGTCRFLAMQATIEPYHDADLVLPRSVNYENEGTVVTTDRRLCKMGRALSIRKQNWEMLADLARSLGIGLDLSTVQEATAALLPELKYNRDDRNL